MCVGIRPLLALELNKITGKHRLSEVCTEKTSFRFLCVAFPTMLYYSLPLPTT
ncbi:AAEL016963-PA [Aedes aegypti]|uniref:AAEL016963-PA n=1 Tax=Aedes aegypti TaxID=7159 RepID=J9HHM5_AEDAE|nr:AAEL016963-PA [Aedes aegypti]